MARVLFIWSLFNYGLLQIWLRIVELCFFSHELMVNRYLELSPMSSRD